MKRLLVLLTGIAIAVAMAIPVGAVTFGERDGNDHPYVGLSVYFWDDPDDGTGELVASHRCSGTLISPTVYVTAGHCTDGMEAAIIWLAEDVESDQGSNGYPIISDADDLLISNWGEEGHTVDGTPHTFPKYDPDAFFLNDLGVVVLDQSVTAAGLYDGSKGYGLLPTDGQFDDLKIGRHTTFTSVGYGLQFSTAAIVQADKIRYQAQPWLIQNNESVFLAGSYAFVLSNNGAEGGTCFGDSGGPNFIGDTQTIAAITSYGLNLACGGTGGVWRLDRQDALDWINSLTS